MKLTSVLFFFCFHAFMVSNVWAATVFSINFDLTNGNDFFGGSGGGSQDVTTFDARGEITINGGNISADIGITADEFTALSFNVDSSGSGGLLGDFESADMLIFSAPKNVSNSKNEVVTFLGYSEVQLDSFDSGQDSYDLTVGSTTTTNQTDSPIILTASSINGFTIAGNSGSFRVKQITANFSVPSNAVAVPEPRFYVILAIFIGIIFVNRRQFKLKDTGEEIV